MDSTLHEDEVIRRGDGNSSTSRSLCIEKEHMFDKVVTPSDVGKLNRLVIPKQHAEKYFPLDSAGSEKGLLLNFEDRDGKPWRFRYSYWNSSQSYVMTKGWSRFVKEKKLDAGDIVSFQRGIGDFGKHCLFIDWRRRPDIPEQTLRGHPNLTIPNHFSFQQSSPWSPLLLRPMGVAANSLSMPHDHFHWTALNNALGRNGGSNSGGGSYSNSYGYGSHVVNRSSVGSPVYYWRSGAEAVGGVLPVLQAAQPFGMAQVNHHQHASSSGRGAHQYHDQDHEVHNNVVYESVPVVQGKASAKRLRLFGVNMDCPITESDELSSSSTPIMPSHQDDHYDYQPSQVLASNSPQHDTLQLRGHKGKSSMSLDFDI